MGCCCSNGTAAVGDSNALIGKAQEDEKRTWRVLILGASDSGKTTLVKQMHKSYTEVTEDQRLSVATSIKKAIICYLITLSQKSKDWEQLRPECKVRSPEMDALADELRAPTCVLLLEPENVEQFTALWEDEGIQRTFESRNEFALAENVAYFMGRMQEIAEPSYVPTFEDYIRFSDPSTEDLEESFEVKFHRHCHKLKVTDICGSLSQRKKWMDAYKDTTNIHGVVYVVAANGYDTVLFEDTTQNRWRDSLQLFGQLAETLMFDNTSVVLLFNKNDLFEAKIKKVPVTVEFSEEFAADDTVTDPNDATQVLQFLFNMFEKIFKEKVAKAKGFDKSFRGKVSKDLNSGICWHSTTFVDSDPSILFLEDIYQALIERELSAQILI